MKKIHKISFFALLAGLLFFAKNSIAQSAMVSEKNPKTVVYKIKKRDGQNSLTPKQVIEIDKLLISKKGILASTTNGSTRLVSVKMEDNFPEVEIKKILGAVLKLEVESLEIIDNKK